jgi:hypothetical protein
VSKVVVVETWRQLARIEVIQSLNVVIATIGVDTVVVPNMNVARRGVVIGSIVNLSHGLSEFSMGRNLSRSLELPTGITRVFGTLQMVFTNPIMTIHVHKTIDQPPMNSKAARRYRSKNGKDPKRGY